MSQLVAYLTVLVAAAIPWLEVLLVVPAGIIAGLPPVPTVVVASIGNVITLVPLVLAGDRVRAWWRARRHDRDGRLDRDGRHQRPGHEAVPVVGDGVTGAPTGASSASAGDELARSRRGARAQALFERFGLPGLAVIGPLLTGVHVAAIAALAAGAHRRATIGWLTAGIVVWAAIAAAATVLGLEALVDPDDLPDLFTLATR